MDLEDSIDQELAVAVDQDIGELPPPLPAGLLETVDTLPEGFTFEVLADLPPSDLPMSDVLSISAGMIE